MANREMIDVVLRMYRHCEPFGDCDGTGCEKCKEALNDIIEALEVDLVRCGECVHESYCCRSLRPEGHLSDDFCSCGERRSDEERSNKQTVCDRRDK